MPATPVVDGQMTTRQELNRKVRVIYKKPADAEDDNDFPEVYKEEFQGRTFEIPTDGSDGPILGYLKAEKFLSAMPQYPPIKLDTGKYVHAPKALRIVKVEETKFVPNREVEKNTCVLCDFVAHDSSGLKRHTTVKHPEYMKDE